MQHDETEAPDVKLADNDAVRALQEHVFHLEGLVERLQNRVVQYAGYFEDHADFLDRHERVITETREYLGFVPPRIQMWDGIMVQTVHNMGEWQRYPSQRLVANQMQNQHPRYNDPTTTSAKATVSTIPAANPDETEWVLA